MCFCRGVRSWVALESAVQNMDGAFQQIAPKFKDEAIAFLKKVGQFAASHVKTAASGFHGRSVHSLGNTVLLRSVRVRDLRCDSVFGKKFINKFVVVFFAAISSDNSHCVTGSSLKKLDEFDEVS